MYTNRKYDYCYINNGVSFLTDLKSHLLSNTYNQSKIINDFFKNKIFFDFMSEIKEMKEYPKSFVRIEQQYIESNPIKHSNYSYLKSSFIYYQHEYSELKNKISEYVREQIKYFDKNKLEEYYKNYMVIFERWAQLVVEKWKWLLTNFYDELRILVRSLKFNSIITYIYFEDSSQLERIKQSGFDLNLMRRILAGL